MSWIECAIFLATVVALAYPFGSYLACVCERRRTFLDPLLHPVEAALYRLLGVHAEQEMSAATYAGCFLLFGAGCAVLLFLILMLQRTLSGGPADAYLTTPMTVDLAANTAVSFTTTTTWQAYAGESTLRYLSQLIGLVAQNFLAAAGGLAVGFAFIRGLARQSSATLGNFWVDLVRSLLWVLLPLALIGSLALIWQGVPLNLSPYTLAHTLEGRTQVIAQGPVAALEFIKNLGTNGGILQRKRRASLRQPDSVDEPHRYARHLCAAGCTHHHTRSADAATACRLAAVVRHGGAVRRRPGGVRSG